jgi:hypothetical protein
MKDMNLNDESFPPLLKYINDSKLKDLYLDFNPIGDVAVLLANLLKANSTLRVLSLKRCYINSISLICVGKALEVNSVLESLNLEDNEFEEQALVEVKKIIIERHLKIKLYLTAKTLKLTSNDSFEGISNIVII